MTYDDIAQQARLDEETTRRFIEYMRRRWPGLQDEQTLYLSGQAWQWAVHFKYGQELAYADFEGHAILKEMDRAPGGSPT